jgi:hypothetical protein
MERFEGDGIDVCDSIIPQIVGIAPSFGYSEESTLVTVSFLYQLSNLDYMGSTIYCRFGSVMMSAENLTDTTLQCRVHARPPQSVEVSISFDGMIWSRERFIFVYKRRFHMKTILPLVFLYGILILGVAAVIWTFAGRLKGEAKPDETEAFLWNQKKSKGVGFVGKKGVKQRLGP